MQRLGGVDQIGETAAEATAHYLPGQNVIGLDEAGIHEIAALIVEDRRHTDAARLKYPRGRDDQGSLPCAEEAPDGNDGRAKALVLRFRLTMIHIALPNTAS